MGRVKKLLNSSNINPASNRYSNLYSIERAEDSFHLHWRNLRLEFDQEEFELFTTIISGAQLKWQQQNKPGITDGDIDCYFTGNIKPASGINPNGLRIELDDLMGEAIHLHYKSNRLELSETEFDEFAKAIALAHMELKKFRGEN